MEPFKKLRDQQHPRLSTADHLIPRALGGLDTPANIVAACYDCNTTRRDMVIAHWLPRLELKLKLAGNPGHFAVLIQRLVDLGLHAARA